MVLIAGTGSIAYGVNEHGFAARSGGWGYVIGDEGSGYWIGRQALTAVVREADGRGPRTRLTPLVLEHFQLARVDGLVREVYDRNLRRPAIAALGPLVDRARAEGDVVGVGDPCASRAKNLTHAAASVIGRLQMRGAAFRVMLSGGMFRAMPWLVDDVVRRLAEVAPRATVDAARRRARAGGGAPGARQRSGGRVSAAVSRGDRRDPGVTREVFPGRNRAGGGAGRATRRRHSSSADDRPRFADRPNAARAVSASVRMHARGRVSTGRESAPSISTNSSASAAAIVGSYRRFMDERFFAHVNIDADNIGFLDGRAHDLGVECARYDRAIVAGGGIDVLMLGIGVNGHIGFNEPADALIAASHKCDPRRADAGSERAVV